jgi:type II secretory pathway pseudopilin PulG
VKSAAGTRERAPKAAARPTRRLARRWAPGTGTAGLTLIELIVAFTLLLILSMIALPLATVKVRRQKERHLREALYDMRKAIDRHKDLADAGKLGELDPDNHGYPESLEVLVEGVEIAEGGVGMPGAGGGLGLPLSQGGGMNQGQGGGFGGNSSFGGSSGFGGMGGGGMRGGGMGGSSRGSGMGGSGFGGNRQSSSGNRSSGFGNSGGMSDPLDSEDAPTKVRFLRKIPIDPITGTANWGMRSMSDDPGSLSWGGRNVFDVFSLSYELSLDGTPYYEW